MPEKERYGKGSSIDSLYTSNKHGSLGFLFACRAYVEQELSTLQLCCSQCGENDYEHGKMSSFLSKFLNAGKVITEQGDRIRHKMLLYK